MSEHLTEKDVVDYCRRKLSASDLLSVSDHLGACELCRQQIESALGGDAAFFALRSEVFDEAAELSSPPLAPTHLTVEQTAAYVDSKLAGEELQEVKDHLSGCELCALVVDDLGAFRHQIAPSLDREYHPAAVPASTENWRPRGVASLAALFRWPSRLALSAALMLVLVAVAGWLIWRTVRETKPREEIVESPAPPPEAVPVPVVAQLNDGEGQLTLDQEGKLSGADNLPPAYHGMLKEALTNQRIERSPLMTGLARPASSLMSGDKEGNKFSVIEPIGKVVLADRVTFRWSPLNGAAGYIVEVYDRKFNLVTTSVQLTANSWTTPQSLRRGGIYSWQVKAVKDGEEFKSPRPPAPQAKFRILDQAKANELAQARRAYASSHVVLGLLYAQAGLVDEAEQEFRALQKANPDSEIARRLLSRVQALQR